MNTYRTAEVANIIGRNALEIGTACTTALMINRSEKATDKLRLFPSSIFSFRICLQERWQDRSRGGRAPSRCRRKKPALRDPCYPAPPAVLL